MVSGPLSSPNMTPVSAQPARPAPKGVSGRIGNRTSWRRGKPSSQQETLTARFGEPRPLLCINHRAARGLGEPLRLPLPRKTAVLGRTGESRIVLHDGRKPPRYTIQAEIVTLLVFWGGLTRKVR